MKKNAQPIKRNSWITSFVFILFACFFISKFAACKKNHDNDNTDDVYAGIQPKGPKPSWGQSIKPQMQTVIEVLDTIAPSPIHDLTPAQARLQPSAADAAMRVMTNFGIAAPVYNVDTSGRDIPVDGGNIHLRIYKPRTGRASYPVIVYYHGGGWVIATNDTYKSSAYILSEKTDAVLVSVEYRKGPEFKFPTAHNDAFAAYKWVLANSASINGDSTKVAVAGESAGGNMAIAVSRMAIDSGLRKPVHELSVYPVASNNPSTPSKIAYVNAKPLSTPDLPWFLSYYLNDVVAESADWRISLVNANLSGLPSTTIIAAELDPLQSEGRTLADLLVAAGVNTTYQLYTGVTHEFFGMRSVVPEARDAEDFAVQQLKNAFQ